MYTAAILHCLKTDADVVTLTFDVITQKYKGFLDSSFNIYMSRLVILAASVFRYRLEKSDCRLRG